MQSVPAGFQIKNVPHPFDAENELLLLTDGNRTIKFIVRFHSSGLIFPDMMLLRQYG